MKLPVPKPRFRLVPLFCYILFLLVLVVGCAKEAEEVTTLLDHDPGFHVTIPSGFKVDEKLNPNNEVTATWFREDGQGLIAVDRQPLAGKRLKFLQEKGKKSYLAQAVRDMKRDLGNRLEVFSHFQGESLELGEVDAVLVSFVTRHEGTDYDVNVLLTLQLGEPAHEVMLEMRLPHSEEDHTTWKTMVKSWGWGAKKVEKHGKEDGGEKAEKKSGSH